MQTRKLKHYEVVSIIIVLLMAAILGYGCYDKGLFFSPANTVVGTVAVSLGFLGFLYLWFSSEIKKTPAWVILAWLYAIYSILTSLWAANAELAIGGAVEVCAAVMLGTMSAYLSQQARSILLILIAASGPLLYIFGMAANLGWIHYTQAVEGNMMDSVFQYHNTFGAYELAIGVIAALLAGLSEHKYTTNLYYYLCSIFSFVGVAQSFSRWVWILAALSVLLMFAFGFAAKKLRRNVVVSLTVLLVAMAAVPFSLMSVKHSSQTYFGLTCLTIIGGGVICYAVIQKMRRTPSKTVKRIGLLSFIIIPATAVFLTRESGKLSPVIARIHSISFQDHSLTQRFWYYGAGLHMWLNNFFFGSGSGTWAAKFQSFEQYPYWTTMTHSIFIDQLVNFGLIGTAIWAGILLACGRNAFISVVKRKSESGLRNAIVAMGALMLLLHALFDFDMNFPVVVWVFFILLGLSNPVEPSDRDLASSPSWPKLVGMASALAVLIFGALLSKSEIDVEKAQVTTDTNKRIALYTDAIKWAPYNANAHGQLSTLYFNRYTALHSPDDEQRAWEQAMTATAYAQWDPSIQDTMARIAYQTHHNQQAYDWSGRAYPNGRFRDNYLENHMAIALWSGVGEFKQNPTDAKQVFESVLQGLSYAESNQKTLSNLPSGQPPEWSYSVTSPIKVYAAAADYCLGNYQRSIDDMQNLSQGTDSYTMELFNMIFRLDQARLSHTPLTAGQIAYGDAVITKEYNALAQIGGS